MTPFWSAAIVVVGSLGLLNLLLTFGVVRRLREHDAALARQSGSAPAPILPAGARVGDFNITTRDREAVSIPGLSGPTVVGFFSGGCPPCHDLMPEFVEYARTAAGGRDSVIVVVVGDGDTESLIAQAQPVAKVVVEADDGPVAAAFGVSGYPSTGVVDRSGIMLASGIGMRALRIQTRS